MLEHMHLVILLCLLLVAPLQALAMPISYQLNGLFADSGTVTGSWTIDAGQITASSFTALPTFNNAPSLTASVSEYCSGFCVFAFPEPVEFFRVNGTNQSYLRLTFTSGFGELISNSSWLESYNADGSFHSLIVVARGEAVSVPVPEGSELIFFGLGMLTLALWHSLRQNWTALP
jgi:hypothetical protein